MTAGRVGGVELRSRGGWLSFALIWTQAGGVVRGSSGERVGWVEKGKPAQHHHNGSLASLYCISDTLYPSLLQSTSQSSTGLDCSALLTVLELLYAH